jgi:AraC family transcriptional regulator
VTAIAFAAGYETHESFTRAFRVQYDCSPSEFRQSRLTPRSACTRPFQIELAARSGIHFEPDRTEPPRVHFTQGESFMIVEIKELPERRVATITHVGPYNRISEAFARLNDVQGLKELFTERPIMLAIYHDDAETTPPSELRSEAGLVVPAGVKLPPGVDEQRLPAGRYATTLHIGPYAQLGDVWARFMGEWLPRSGQRMAHGSTFEVYRNTPEEVPSEQLETELYIPLA